MTSFDPNYIARYGHPFKGWDDSRPTAECRHCHGTGYADGCSPAETTTATPCGFCYGKLADSNKEARRG